MKPSSFPRTLTEAVRYYSDVQTCINAVAVLRWADGKPICPKCNTAEGERKHYWLKTQSRWKCYSCRKQFSVKVGTIFEDSPLGLNVWMIALWMLCNCRNGVSSYEIARATGIAQKSAWFLLQRLRLVMKEVKPVMMGATETPVEMDECFVGGKPENMHRARRLKQRIGTNGYAEKTAIFWNVGAWEPPGSRNGHPERQARDATEKKFLSRWAWALPSTRMVGRVRTDSPQRSLSTKQ